MIDGGVSAMDINTIHISVMHDLEKQSVNFAADEDIPLRAPCYHTIAEI